MYPRTCTWMVLAGVASAACGRVQDVPRGAAPTLVSATPEMDATRVAPLTSLAFVFDKALDPATVMDAIRVTYRSWAGAFPIRGSVSYDDATYTVTFTPKQPLPVEKWCQVQLAPTMTDGDGIPFAGASIDFHTAINGQTKRISYTDGVMRHWYAYELNDNGRLTKTLRYAAAGADTRWFTSDDVVAERTDVAYSGDDDGHSEDVRSYGAGPDAVLNTSDDVQVSSQKTEFDAEGRFIRGSKVTGPGPDGVWRTADDTFASVVTQTFEGSLARTIITHDAGADGTWLTADDLCTTYNETTWDMDFAAPRTLFKGCGEDKRPLTNDDRITSYEEVVFKSPLRRRVHRNAGSDNEWFTPDDGITSVQESELDSAGLVRNFLNYTNPGIDGRWLTADDVVTYRDAYELGANGLKSSHTFYNGPGPDNRFNTADDSIQSFDTHQYDASGLETGEKHYVGPGPDNIWNTGDDRLGSETEFDLNH